MKRRTFAKTILTGGTAVLIMAAGLFSPRRLLAAWPRRAFETTKLDEALKEIFGSDIDAAPNAAIKIDAPDIADNGALVPVTISTDIPHVESIAIIGEGNPIPLIAHFRLTPAVVGKVSTRIKMGKTSNVTAVVKAGGTFYRASKKVIVTVGGCDG